jgi:hypothetical protein
MTILRLFFPGDFEDAYVYMGRLVTLTTSRSVRFYNLDKITAELEERYAGLAPVFQLAFARNDWLASEQLRSLSRNAGVVSALRQTYERFPQPVLEIQESLGHKSEEDLNIRARVLLDLLIYNSRMYVASDAGLYRMDMDLNADQCLGAPETKLEARCLSTTAGYGSVHASCGDEGLFSSFDEESPLKPSNRSGMRFVAEKSLRTQWLSYDLVNYSRVVSPLLLHSQQERADSFGPERERKQVIGFDETPLDLGYLLQALVQKHKLREDALQFVYNSSRVFFVHTYDGSFYTFGISSNGPGEPSLKLAFTKRHDGTSARVIGAHTAHVGLVVETDKDVQLFAGDMWSTILPSEAISVRTFPRSKRFQNLVAITLEAGILLAAIIEDPPESDHPAVRRSSRSRRSSALDEPSEQGGAEGDGIPF